MELHTARSLLAVHGLDEGISRPVSAPLSGTLAALRRWLRAWAKHRQDQRDYANLLHRPERELEDIGLTREMVEARMSPFWRTFGDGRTPY